MAYTTSDDYANSTATTGTVNVGGQVTGNLELPNDEDWFKVSLQAGTTYVFDLLGADGGGGTLGAGSGEARLALYDTRGYFLDSAINNGTGGDPRLSFSPTTTGTYYLGVSDLFDKTGTYTLKAAVGVSDDYADSTATTGVVNVGGQVTGNLELPNDEDWFKVSLQAGTTYVFDLLGADGGGGTLGAGSGEARLALHDTRGYFLDSAINNGTGGDPRLSFNPTTTGTYYLGVSDLFNMVGTYTLKAAAASTDSTYTLPTFSVTETVSNGKIVLALSAIQWSSTSNTLSFTISYDPTVAIWSKSRAGSNGSYSTSIQTTEIGQTGKVTLQSTISNYGDNTEFLLLDFLLPKTYGTSFSYQISNIKLNGVSVSSISDSVTLPVKQSPTGTVTISGTANDYNGDGKADLRWVKDSGEVSLWLMNGTAPTATANFGPFNGWSVKDGSQDFNGDGKTDLLWSNANGAVSVWTMDGLNATAIADHGPYAGWKLVDAAGDYNGDGKADLRWAKDNGEVSLWLMNATVPTATANFGPFNGWSVKDGSQDFNGDGKTDLLWTNASGAASIWTMDGLNAISIANHGPYTGWKLVDAAGDYNGDGKADLRWVSDSGEVSLWLMNGANPTATANFGPFNGWSVKDGSRDFNGDGKTDLLWTNASGAASIWTMDGLNATAIVDHGPYVGWQLVDAAGDYNDDGKADLRWVKDSGEVSLWLMNGTVPTATANFGPFNGWGVKDSSQDFNGDGKTDLLWANANGAASIWTMDGLVPTATVNHGPYSDWKVADLQPTTATVSLVGIQDPGSY